MNDNGSKKLVITIGGLPGSGTTTAAELLSKKLELPWTNAGKIFRELAQEKGMDLNEFGRYAEGNSDVDRELDRRLVEIMREGDIIIEGRLASANANINGIHALKVWLHAPIKTRVKRIRNRESGDLVTIMKETHERERSERKRYKDYYNIDYENLDYYTLVISSAELWPEQIVHVIMETLKIKGMV